MASRMLGVDAEEAGEERWDAVGEVCNMVTGNFKNKLPGLSERCMLSCPTVIAGSDYQCRPVTGGQALSTVMLFEGTAVSVVLEINDAGHAREASPPPSSNCPVGTSCPA
jgi:CheY-specific phosphatase CheX